MQPLWSGILPTGTLQSYVNAARSQVAFDAECIRDRLFVNAVSGQNVYRFAQDLSASLPDGTVQPISVLEIAIEGSGPIDFRPWPWYWQYFRWSPAVGKPTVVAQLGQGTAGTLYFHPTPDQAYPFVFDVTLLPSGLNGSTGEVDAIPYPWTDAVAFWAAWLAFMQMQRQADAQMMMDRYKELVLRGTQGSTATVLPENYQGGAGAKMAAMHSTLTMAPQRPALGG